MDIYDKDLKDNNVKTLQRMCIYTLYEIGDKEYYCKVVLPELFANLLDDYNDYKETDKYYYHDTS